jgi:hypothetical protein
VANHIDRPILRLLLVVALLRPLKGFRETDEAICILVGPEGEDCLQLSAVTMTHQKVTALLHFRSTPVSPKNPSKSFSEDKAQHKTIRTAYAMAAATAEAVTTPVIHLQDCTYTSCYCEENVYLLINKLVQQQQRHQQQQHHDSSQLFAVFISNPSETVSSTYARICHAHHALLS